MLETEDTTINQLKNAVSNSIKGQEPSLLNTLSRKFVDRVDKSQTVEIQRHSVGVTKVTREKFVSGYNNAIQGPHTEVSMSSWQISKDSEVMLNIGAGPCLIIYAHDQRTGEMLSGHYPSTRLNTDLSEATRNRLGQVDKENKEKKVAEEQILIPSKKDVREYSEFFSPSVDNYNSLIDEITARAREGHEIDIYLFGQDRSMSKPETEQERKYIPNVITSYIKDQLAITDDLEKSGIENDSIHDYREPPGYQESSTTYTQYSPQSGIEYYAGDPIKRKVIYDNS